MNNLTLALKQGPATIATSLPTGSTGAYAFNNICPGTYTIEVTINNKSVGGINSTDAGAVNYWGAAFGEIEHVKFLAGDVAKTLNFINATDASRVQRYFVYGTPFDKDPWSYWKKGDKVLSNSNPIPIPTSFLVTVTTSNIVNFDLYGMCTGDFNGSFVPGTVKSASTTIQLLSENVKKIGAGQEFELGLRTSSRMEVGAVSLILDLPSDLVEVSDVSLIGSNDKPDFAINGNALTIGWNSTTPVSTEVATDLVVLKLKTTANFTEGKTIRLSLASDPLNELADGSSTVIQDVILNTDIIANSPVGMTDQSGNNALTLINYPNPFTESTTLRYTLPVDGYVSIEIHDMIGQVIKTLVDKNQASGTYTLKVDARTMSQGVYTAILRVHNDNAEMVKTIKFVVNK